MSTKPDGTEKNEYEKAYAEQKARERAEHEAEWMKWFGEAARGARTFEECEADPEYHAQLARHKLFTEELDGSEADFSAAEAEAASFNAEGRSFRRADGKPPPRPWLYGHKLLRGHVTLSVATGGIMKSMLTMTEAAAMASGRKLLHIAPPWPLTVLCVNLEDTEDELARRFYAICEHFDIPDEALGDQLYLHSARDRPLKLVVPVDGIPIVQWKAVYRLIRKLRRLNVDVLILDPLVSLHLCEEGDNVAMDMLVKLLNRMSALPNTAIYMVHHARKMAVGEDNEADASRGASAVVNAARVVNRLRRMTKEEAALVSIADSERHLYICEIAAKANFSKMGEGTWYKLASVPLDNGTAEYPAGDEVGVPAPWHWPDLAAAAKERRTDPVLIREVQAIVRAGQWRANHSAKEFIGPALYPLLGLDPAIKTKPAAATQVEKLVECWLADGWLTEVTIELTRKNRAKERVTVLAVGKEAEAPGAADDDDEGDL